MFNGFNQVVAADGPGHGLPDRADRRRFLRFTALAGLGVAGVGALGATAGTGFAGPAAERRGIDDTAVLNLLLNVSYLLAEFGLRGAFGTGLEAELVGGAGRVGRLAAGRPVSFASARHRRYAEEIATDQRAQVRALRGLLGPAKVGRPDLDLDAGFTAAAAGAGLVAPGQRFDAFAGENHFLLGTHLLTDLGVQASRGALSLLAGGPAREATSELLAAQAFQAGTVRTMVLDNGLEQPARAMAEARASLGGRTGSVREAGTATGQLLNALYLSPRSVTAGGFFPWGVNGELTRSERLA